MKQVVALIFVAALTGCTSHASYQTRDGRIVDSHGTWHLGAPSHTHTIEYSVTTERHDLGCGFEVSYQGKAERTGEWFSHGPSALSQILPSAAAVAAAHEIRHGLEESGDTITNNAGAEADVDNKVDALGGNSTNVIEIDKGKKGKP